MSLKALTFPQPWLFLMFYHKLGEGRADHCRGRCVSRPGSGWRIKVKSRDRKPASRRRSSATLCSASAVLLKSWAVNACSLRHVPSFPLSSPFPVVFMGPASFLYAQPAGSVTVLVGCVCECLCVCACVCVLGVAALIVRH